MSGKRIRDLSDRPRTRWEDVVDTPSVSASATSTLPTLPSSTGATMGSTLSDTMPLQLAALQVEPASKRTRQEEKAVASGRELIGSVAASSTDAWPHVDRVVVLENSVENGYETCAPTEADSSSSASPPAKSRTTQLAPRHLNDEVVERRQRDIAFQKQLKRYEEHRRCKGIGPTTGDTPRIEDDVSNSTWKKQMRVFRTQIRKSSEGHRSGRCSCKGKRE